MPTNKSMVTPTGTVNLTKDGQNEGYSVDRVNANTEKIADAVTALTGGLNDLKGGYTYYQFNAVVPANGAYEAKITFDDVGMAQTKKVLFLNIRRAHSEGQDDLYYGTFYSFSYSNAEREIYFRMYNTRATQITQRMIVDIIQYTF